MTSGSATEIPVSLIDPGSNVRFSTGEIAELVASIKGLGIVVPLVLRRKRKRYEIVAGHRRFAAARRLKLKSVPATIRNVADEDVVGFMVAENVHRRGLTPLEIGTALKQMHDEGLTQVQIGERMGKSPSWVSNHLRLMSLSKEIQQKVHRKELTLQRALGYGGAALGGITGGGGHTSAADAVPAVEGLVYVVLGLHGGLETPTVHVETDQEVALERRAELIRANTHRKVVICPYNVGEREEGAA